MEATTERMTVIQHPEYNSLCPEEFNWQLVISEKTREIAVMLADETKCLVRAQNSTQQVNLTIGGLQVALRMIAARAVWKVSQVREEAAPVPQEQPAKETPDVPHNVPSSQFPRLGDAPLPAVGATGFRLGRG